MQVICKHLLARLAFRAFPCEKFRAFFQVSEWLDAAVGWGSGVYNKYNGRAKLLLIKLMAVGINRLSARRVEAVKEAGQWALSRVPRPASMSFLRLTKVNISIAPCMRLSV